jgi:4-hydroxybenzoate polyprenyltransferase
MSTVPPAAVGAFTLAAASGYCVNDLADLERDRRHPAKRSARSPPES